MLTKMTEEDWEIVLEVFDAAQSETKPIISKHYKSPVERGRPKKVALVACMRRLFTALLLVTIRHFNSAK